MELSKLGKKSKGKKHFRMESDTEFGYNVRCEHNGHHVTYQNIKIIEWMYQGEEVYLDPNPNPGKTLYKMNGFSEVVISKAKIKHDGLILAETF